MGSLRAPTSSQWADFSFLNASRAESMPMDARQQKLPICFDCQFGAGFPCRDAEGTLEPDRLVNALRVLANEEPDTPIYDENFWALDCMDTIVAERPELGFKLIVFALTYFKEPPEIGYLAAGPLENLVHFNGARMIDAIEREAADNERFRFLLSGIWGESSVDPQIWRRIQRAVEAGPWIDQDPRTPQGSRKPDGG